MTDVITLLTEIEELGEKETDKRKHYNIHNLFTLSYKSHYLLISKAISC